MPGGGGQGAEVGGGVGFEGPVGGPEQAVVAVAFALGGEPAGERHDLLLRCRAGAGFRRCAGRVLAGGLEEAGGGGPVQGAPCLAGRGVLVGAAADLGGRGQDVAAVGQEVDVAGGEVAAALLEPEK